jgi:hypothetical protein
MRIEFERSITISELVTAIFDKSSNGEYEIHLRPPFYIKFQKTKGDLNTGPLSRI